MLICDILYMIKYLTVLFLVYHENSIFIKAVHNLTLPKKEKYN